jgi:hypothetical protein
MLGVLKSHPCRDGSQLGIETSDIVPMMGRGCLFLFLLCISQEGKCQEENSVATGGVLACFMMRQNVFD